MDKKRGNIVDVLHRTIFFGEVEIDKGRIVRLNMLSDRRSGEFPFIMPGLVDSHIHIESSMLIPSEFAKVALRHGTVATVSDPHEIANVVGIEGVKFMIKDGKNSNLKFHWGAPSCVPATEFETSGSSIKLKDLEELFQMNEIVCLSEMMNFPGVIFGDPIVTGKLDLARRLGKPIDGHAPGLKGAKIKKYAEAGITTDHESSTIEEAIEKIKLGIYIQIRNGSSAKNFKALFPLIDQFPERVMLCSDDLHPEDLIVGHINRLLAMGIAEGLDLFNLLQAAIVNPIYHYRLDVGMLQPGDLADFILLEDLTSFNVLETWINGACVYKKGFETRIEKSTVALNNFTSYHISSNDLLVPNKFTDFIAIEVTDGELITKKRVIGNRSGKEFLDSDVTEDILKIVVVNRYQKSKPVVGFVKNFNLKKGALASSVAHDSHNIIAVGTNDEDIAHAINLIMDAKGGIVAVHGADSTLLSLPVAGLMSLDNAEVVSERYLALNKKAKEFGSHLKAPFMTMSFMALLVIPELKIGDRGLFDVNKFSFTSLFV